MSKCKLLNLVISPRLELLLPKPDKIELVQVSLQEFSLENIH